MHYDHLINHTHNTARITAASFLVFLCRAARAACSVMLCFLPLLGSFSTSAVAQTAAPATGEGVRKAAIFVANRADKSFDEKLATFEDFISSRVTEKGFSVISREAATDALSSLLKDSKQTDADQLLSNNSSTLRLGQMLGTDYLVLASISSYGTDKKTVDAYGEKTVNITHNLRVTYKIPQWDNPPAR